MTDLVYLPDVEVADCAGVCRALFGQALELGAGTGLQSWKTDRPMRKQGFNTGAARRSGADWVTVQNSGHGGAGVAASWACAARAVTAFLAELPNQGKAW